MMLLRSKGRLFWIVTTVLLIGIVVVITTLVQSKPDVVIETRSTKESGVISIDYRSYKSKFSDEQRYSINKSLTEYIDITMGAKNGLSASARDDSYSVVSSADGVPLVTMLIDVLKIKKTYMLSFEGGPGFDRGILYIRCAPQDTQIDKSSECKDVET